MNLSIPKLTHAQRTLTANLVVDIGKLFFAAGVIGYFFPDIARRVSLVTLLFGFTVSLVLFAVGVSLIKRTQE